MFFQSYTETEAWDRSTQRKVPTPPILEGGGGGGKREAGARAQCGAEEGYCLLLQAPADVMALRVLVVLHPSTRKHGGTKPSFL